MMGQIHNYANQREHDAISSYMAKVSAFECPKRSRHIAKTVYAALLSREQITRSPYPDFSANYKGKLWCFEHFEFDDTQRFKGKGSTARKTSDDIDRFKKKIAEPQVLLAGNLTCTIHSIRNYIDNVMASFDYHYSRIGNYGSVIEDLYKNRRQLPIKIGFIIEDSNKDGSVYMDESVDLLPDGPLPPKYYLSLAKCDEFLDYFDTRMLVDFVLLMYITQDKKTHIEYLDHLNIQQYRKKQICVSHIESCGFVCKEEQYTFSSVAGPGSKEINETIPVEFREQVQSMRKPTQIIYPSKKK